MPEPRIVDREDLCEVEAVLTGRIPRSKRQVLVKWTGVDLLSATWKPIENIPQACLDGVCSVQAAEGEGATYAEASADLARQQRGRCGR